MPDTSHPVTAPAAPTPAESLSGKIDRMQHLRAENESADRPMFERLLNDATRPSEFMAALIATASALEPTQADRLVLARAAVKTAREALRAGDLVAVEFFIEEALRQTQGG